MPDEALGAKKKHRFEDEADPRQPKDRRLPRPQRLGFSKYGMAATAHHLATDAAVEVLELGGNAVDAAVAAALALGVCEPNASGLGGQTMMLVHLSEQRQTIALDGSSRAPNRVTADALRPKERREGHRATTVPSTPAVLGYALRRYGTLKRAAVFTPAIRLAEEGFQVSELLSSLMRRAKQKLVRAGGGRTFLAGGLNAYPVGGRLKQPDLALTLRRLMKKGTRDFYRGEIAALIHEDMQRHGGLLQRDDLAQIPTPIERRPVTTKFRGDRVVTFPPPGAGRTLIEMLNLVNALQHPLDLDSPKGAVILSKIIRQAFRDRRDRPFEPNYYAQVPDKEMLSPSYAKRVARDLMKEPEDHGETTHLTVMDRFGNVVSLTQSIELVFGSGAVAGDLGFLYNNYLSAFEYDDIGHPYYLRPNAVPWASVAPTIVFKGRRPSLALGSPGSERIVSSILQVLMRLGVQTPLDAVSAPRLHCALSGEVSLEVERMRNDIPPALEKAGFTIDPREAFSFYLGCVQLVLRDRTGFVGVADPRRDGSARGPSR
jgi:gamma-glutamyltranspeptidase/glutathione hydrolase